MQPALTEAIAGVIGQSYGFLCCAEGQYSQDGAKYLRGAGGQGGKVEGWKKCTHNYMN